MLVGVNAATPGGEAASQVDAEPARVHVVASSAELLRALEGRGAVRLGPAFAVLALLACVAEPLVRRRMKTGGGA